MNMLEMWLGFEIASWIVVIALVLIVYPIKAQKGGEKR